MAKIDFTPAVVLMAMAIGVVFLKWMGTPAFKGILTQFNTLITQAFTQVQQQPVQAAPPPPPPVVTPPAPAPAPVTPPTPAAEPEGITPATPSAVKPPAAACDCKCMPMDSDPSRQKIETPAGEDCYNHIYPATVAECEAALVGVCASRGGGSTPAPSTTPASEGGGDEDSGGDEDEDEDEDEESANIARVYRVGGFR